jgi:chromosome segregation ATPase
MGSSLNTANGALTTVGASANTTKSAFDGTKTSLDTTKSAFDTTKTSIDTTKTSLDTVKTSVDTTKTSLDTTKTSIDTVKTSLDTTKTSLDAEKTALDTTNTSLGETKTGYDSANTSMETTNTTLGNVTTGITEQKDPLNQLVTEMDNFVTSGNQQISVMEQQLTAIQQENPALKDITATLGQTNTVSKDITPSLQAMTTEFTNAGSPLTSLNTQLTTHNTESATAKTKAEEFGSSLQTAGLAVTSIGTSVFNLIKNVRDYNDGQIKVEATARKVSTSTEALDKAQRQLDADIKAGITTGAKYEQDLLNRNQALSAQEVAIKRNQEAQQAWSDSQVGIVFNSITAVTGVLFTAVGAVEKFGKAWTALKGIMTGGVGMFAIATAGIIASAAAIQGYLANQSATEKFTEVTRDHASSWGDVAAAATKAKQEMSVGLGSLINMGDIGDLTNIEKGAAHFAEKKSFLDSIFLGDITKFRPALQEAIKARILQAQEVLNPVNFHNEQGLPDTEKTTKAIAALNTVLDATVKLVRQGTAEYKALHPAQVAVADQWNVLGQQAKVSASGIITNSNAWLENKDRQIESVVVGQQISTSLDHTDAALKKVTDAQNDYKTGLVSVTDQSQALSTGIQASNVAFRNEELSLGLVADKYGILDTSLAKLVLSETNEVNQIKETIAANLDYSAALTDTQTKQDLVAEGHLQGALKARGFFDEIVRGGAETEQYRNVLVAFATDVLHLQDANELTITQLEEEIRVRTEVGYAAEKERAEKQALKQAVEDVVEAYKAEEKQLVTLAAQNGVYNEKLQELALNEKDNVAQMKELIAASIDVTSAFTDLKENTDLVAEGHLKGTIAVKDFLEKIVEGTAQTETYSAGIKKIIDDVGGLPNTIEPTVQNMEKWIEAIGGSEEALQSLDKTVQDSISKTFGSLNSVFKDMVDQWDDKDTKKELKKKLDDLLPKQYAKQVEMNLDMTLGEQKLNESLDLIQSSLFKAVTDQFGNVSYEIKPGLTLDPTKADDLIKNLQKDVQKGIEEGELPAGVGESLNTMLQDALTRIDAGEDPLKVLREVFAKIKTDIQPQLSTDLNESVTGSIEAIKIDPKAIAGLKEKIQSAFKDLAKKGGPSAVDPNMNPFIPQQGGKKEETGEGEGLMIPVTADTTKLKAELDVKLAEIIKQYQGGGTGGVGTEGGAAGQFAIPVTADTTQVVTALTDLLAAWQTFNDTVVTLEEQLVQAISGLYTETLYGQVIGPTLITAAESWRAYDEIILEQEGVLMEGLAALYGETLLNEVIVATLVTAGESWAAYDEIVIGQEEKLITALVGLYVETFYTAIGEMFITAAGSWNDYEKQVLDQEESMIQALVDLYIKTLYGDGIGPMLVEVAKSFKDYEDTVRESEDQMIADLIKDYKLLFDGAKVVLEGITSLFTKESAKWLKTVKDVVSKMSDEFDKLKDAAKQAVDDINSELSKIKQPTVKVKYDTSGAPKATGADIFYPARAAAGIDFETKRGQPQLLIVGEGATPERVTISRPGEPAYYGAGRSEKGGGGGGGTMIVNDTINIYTSEGAYVGGARTRRVFRNLESH